MMASVSWAVATDVGRVRDTNEDSVLARPPVFVIADGMGGHAGGDVASSLAVAEFAALADLQSLTREDVATAIARGNDRILEHARAQGELGMGTTVTGMAVVAPGGVEHWLVFNVGDSRVYRWTGERLAQITVDHSEVQELVERGEIAPSDARSHRLRSVVTRALGSDPAPEADSWLLPLVPGERFLLCSDGLVAELSDAEIAEALTAETPDAAAELLVRRALEAGGSDNISVIVVDVVAAENGAGGPEEDTKPRLEFGVRRTGSSEVDVPGADG